MAERIGDGTPIIRAVKVLRNLVDSMDKKDKKIAYADIAKFLEGNAPKELSEALEKTGTLQEMLEFLDKFITKSTVPIATPYLPDNSGLVFCNNVGDVQAQVSFCLTNGLILRTAGAQHSNPPVVFGTSTDKVRRIKLEQDLRSFQVISEDKTNGTLTVKVGAGCNLGIDPFDPNSTAENSLFRQLDALGYAVPITGGISHQTVAGYMFTSTAGGSLDFNAADSILSFELVDGKGNVQVIDKAANPDEFNAAAVSMGLYGVLTYVTIVAVKRFLVGGQEGTLKLEDSCLKNGQLFTAALKEYPYLHTTWFPAEGVNSVLQFTAKQVQQDPTTPVIPYVHPLKLPIMNYAAAEALLIIAALDYKNTQWARDLAAFIFNKIQPVDTPKAFQDHWYIALPNDDQALVDLVVRIQWSEMWIDVAEADAVLADLRALFASDKNAAGNLGIEIYAGKQSPYWMSMGYGRDSIRIDVYWWEYNVIGDIESYYEKFWNVLLKYKSIRFHWGKHWPTLGKTYPTQGGSYPPVTMNPEFVNQAFPKFQDWKALRAQFDPSNVFVTKYWNDLLGLY